MQLPKAKEHCIDSLQIKRDVFILLNLGYGLNRLIEDGENDVAARKSADIFIEYGLMYEAEVSTRLINIAVLSRILDDKIINSKSHLCASKFSYEDILGDDEDGNAINLRQCLNKIIHAKSIDHETLHLPELYLNGEHNNGKEWFVRIFIMPFCTAIYQWVNQCKID